MGRLIDPDEDPLDSREIVMHHLYLMKLPPWFDLRVFYIRVSNFEVDDSLPEKLNVRHIPVSPDIILDVNSRRSSIHSDLVTSVLRRDRVDKDSEEATFICTDSIRMTGSVRFEVFFENELLINGVFELSNINGLLQCDSRSTIFSNVSAIPQARVTSVRFQIHIFSSSNAINDYGSNDDPLKVDGSSPGYCIASFITSGGMF